MNTTDLHILPVTIDWIALVIFLMTCTILGYRRSNWRFVSWVMLVEACVFSLSFWISHTPVSILWPVLAVLFWIFINIDKVRRLLVTGPVFKIYKRIMPPLSRTEAEAIDAGTIWWDAELFSGRPDFQKLHSFPIPRLSATEQAFMDGPVEQLCAMIDDWEVVHTRRDLPPEVWQFIKDNGFWGMIIQKKYGGLEFSNYAHAQIVAKLSTRCGTAAVTVMVPNSLGPGELLQHYGTEAQKNYYLPRLARGLEIPCFALTSPYAGSDAGAIPDYGVVCRGSYTDPHTGERHKNVLGMRVTWEKRWITLAPVATLLGLAFKMYDPDHLLGPEEYIGITCALVPTTHQGVQIGRRHFPPGATFMNGPTMGRDVFIPIDWIIGGPEYAGRGWRMLVECLAVGRAISLPALSVACGRMASWMTGAFARIREQFGLSIGRFEGVDEALSRIGGYTYQMDAAQRLGLTGLDLGEKTSVISAILKYHNTERLRKVLNDALDIHGGKAVVLGPRNLLGRAYQQVPVAITVEGANILTRSMIIYGQGAIRCHPCVHAEMEAVATNDVAAFDRAFLRHIGFTVGNSIRSFVIAITGGHLVSVPPEAGPLGRYYQQITRFSSALAALSDYTMLTLGGTLKFREKLSARMGDMLSNLYIATAVLKRYADDGRPKEDLPLVVWALDQAFYDVQQAIDGVLENFPNRVIARTLRWLIFPLGRRFHPPHDHVGTQVAQLMMSPGPARQRLTQGIYVSPEESDPVGVIAHALEAHIAAEATESMLRKAQRTGKLHALTAHARLEEALSLGLIDQRAFDQVQRARRLKREVIMVDDFDPALEQYDTRLSERQAV